MLVPQTIQALTENKGFTVSVADATKFYVGAEVYLGADGLETLVLVVKDIRSATDVFLGADVSDYTVVKNAVLTMPEQLVSRTGDPTYKKPESGGVTEDWVNQQLAPLESALDDKANSSDVYTKLEADALLADKADAADVYTKLEADALLADKADAADVYTKDEVYTKAEVDALINP